MYSPGRLVTRLMGGWRFQRGVSEVMVVHVQPGIKRGAAFGSSGVGAGVGPFVGQSAVEAFDRAVGLRPVGAGPFVNDAQADAGNRPLVGLVARRCR